MAGISHVTMGFGFKRAIPSISVWMLILATEFLEIVWFIAFVIGDHEGVWTHSLLMAIVWAVLFGAVTGAIFRSTRKGLILGALVFSHWIVDLITHPMGAIFGTPGAAPDVPLWFGGPKVGLGLYNYSMPLAIGMELLITVVCLALYFTMNRNKTARTAQN